MEETTNITLTPEEQLKASAHEFVKNGKGRPPKAIATLVKQIKNAEKARARKVVLKNRTDARIMAKQAKQEEKLEAFLEEFMRNGGNATQAALTVHPTASIVYAANLGSQYMKQVKGIAQIHLEKKGYGYGKLMDVAMKKVEDSKTPEWWDRLMKMSGYEDFLTKNVKGGGPAVVNIVGSQRKDMDDFGFAEEGEIIEDDEQG